MENMSNKERIEKLERQIISLSKTLEHVAQLIHTLVSNLHQKEVSQKMIEQELTKIEKTIEEVWDENQRMKQRLVSRTVSLMHQKRKAANNVDDRYFEQEVYIQAHDEISEAIIRHKEMISKQNRILQEWVEHT